MFLRPLGLLAVLSAHLLLMTSCGYRNQPADYYARIGQAVRLANRTCFAVRNAKILPGAGITLITPADAAEGKRVETARAFVSATDAPACPGVSDDSGMSTYNLDIASGKVEPDVPMVALDSRLPSVMAAHSFRSCNSSGVTHLTAWDGAKPLEGHRLWHETYNRGETVGTSCTAAETAAY